MDKWHCMCKRKNNELSAEEQRFSVLRLARLHRPKTTRQAVNGYYKRAHNSNTSLRRFYVPCFDFVCALTRTESETR